MPKLIPNEMLELPESQAEYIPRPRESLGTMLVPRDGYEMQTITPQDMASEEWLRQTQPVNEMQTLADLGSTVDWLSGAPVRATLGSMLQEGDNPLEAFKAGLMQYGKHPSTAPTGSQLAGDMGVSKRPLSDFLEASGYAGHPTGATLADMVGLGIEAGAELPLPLGAMMMPASKVFHGSPHRFDKFDMSKIGTGEGAQAFGHGLYVTDSKEVATDYAKVLGKNYKGPDFDKLNDVQSEIDNTIGKMNVLRKSTGKYYAQSEELPALIDELNGLKQKKAIYESGDSQLFYTSRIPEGEYLQWHKPVSEKDATRIWKQLSKEGLMGKIKKAMKDDPIEGFETLNNHFDKSGDITYQLITEAVGSPKATSEFLNRAGFQGIQYPAGTLSGVTDSKAMNYVLFSDKDLPVNEIKNLSTGEIQKLGGN